MKTIGFVILLFCVLQGVSQNSRVVLVSPDSIRFNINIPELHLADSGINRLSFSAPSGFYEFSVESLDSLAIHLNDRLEAVNGYEVEYELLAVKNQFLLVEGMRSPFLLVDTASTDRQNPQANVIEPYTSPDSIVMRIPCDLQYKSAEWNAFLNHLESIYFEKDKLASIMDYLSVRKVNTQALKSILDILEYDESKLLIIAQSKDKLCDPEQLNQLRNIFTLSANKRKFDTLIGS